MTIILERKKRLPRPHMNGPRLVKVESEVSSRTGKIAPITCVETKKKTRELEEN